jgi:murein DD-endopeptidase MepM/ murein hydrolase activator NlpD
MKNKVLKERIFLGALIVLAILIVAYRLPKSITRPQAVSPAVSKGLPAVTVNGAPATKLSPASKATLAPNTATLTLPLSDALSRVTKKPFGLKVSPGHSPINPEKFSGYHTGVDFETLPSEADVDVSVMAVCTGPLLMKKIATGYGGVAVQECQLDNQIATIIYGHLRSAAIVPKVGEEMAAGQTFAVLGTGYSSETDGERKHLHLGIHIGSVINILGYVQNSADLSGWLDALKYLK